VRRNYSFCNSVTEKLGFVSDRKKLQTIHWQGWKCEGEEIAIKKVNIFLLFHFQNHIKQKKRRIKLAALKSYVESVCVS